MIKDPLVAHPVELKSVVVDPEVSQPEVSSLETAVVLEVGVP
jgi:hypothetical protein